MAAVQDILFSQLQDSALQSGGVRERDISWVAKCGLWQGVDHGCRQKEEKHDQDGILGGAYRQQIALG